LQPELAELCCQNWQQVLPELTVLANQNSSKSCCSGKNRAQNTQFCQNRIVLAEKSSSQNKSSGCA